MKQIDLVLREETLEHEKRTALTPAQVAKLTRDGHKIAVAKWADRIFKDQEYVDSVGKNGNPDNFKLIDPQEWKEDPAYENAVILGVKEIEDKDLSDPKYPLKNQVFVYFDHSFKGQDEAWKRLMRFGFAPDKQSPYLSYPGSGSLLLDLEYLVDEQGKRVAAFGESAGYATAAMTVYQWAKKASRQYPYVPRFSSFSYDKKEDFLPVIADLVKQAIEKRVDQNKGNGVPDTLVLGGQKGRSANGVMNFVNDLNQYLSENQQLPVVRWGREETVSKQRDDGLQGIEKFQLIFNCTFSNVACSPFVTDEKLKKFQDIAFIGDVTADTTDDKNRIRSRNYVTTTFEKPVTKLGRNVSAVTINHSPSFFPRRSSLDFSSQLFPHIKDLLNYKKEGVPIPKNSVWGRALEVFESSMLVPTNAYQLGTIGTQKGQAWPEAFEGFIGPFIENFGRKLTKEELKFFPNWLAMGIQGRHLQGGQLVSSTEKFTAALVGKLREHDFAGLNKTAWESHQAKSKEK